MAQRSKGPARLSVCAYGPHKGQETQRGAEFACEENQIQSWELRRIKMLK